MVSLIQRHLKYTKSAVARAILNDWQSAKQHFVKVFPHEYARALQEQSETKVGLPETLEQLLCALCDGPEQFGDAQHMRYFDGHSSMKRLCSVPSHLVAYLPSGKSMLLPLQHESLPAPDA